MTHVCVTHLSELDQPPQPPHFLFNDIVSCLPTTIKELIYLGNEFDVGDFDGEYRLVSIKEYFEECD